MTNYEGLTRCSGLKLTRAQREALKRVYLRVLASDRAQMNAAEYIGFTYRRFRATVQPGPDCVMVRFASMWLGIERDGYTHS